MVAKAKEKANSPKAKLDRFRDMYPIEGGDPYYRNLESPLHFAFKLMNDERKSLDIRWEAAQAAMPYLNSRPAPRPYVPTLQEKAEMAERKTLTVKIVEFKEVSEGAGTWALPPPGESEQI